MTTEHVSNAPILDEHVDEACFTLALAIRRILGIEARDAKDACEENLEGDQE